MSSWNGYVCKNCGAATQHTEKWQYECRVCGHLVDPGSSIMVAEVYGGPPKTTCPFGGRCQDNCAWRMMNGACAVKKIAVNIDRMHEKFG